MRQERDLASGLIHEMRRGDRHEVTRTDPDRGTIVFYKILDDGSGPRVAGKDTSVLVGPKLEGKVLSFQVKGQNDTLIGFQMELTGSGEGELKGKATQTGGGAPPPVKMTRER